MFKKRTEEIKPRGSKKQALNDLIKFADAKKL